MAWRCKARTTSTTLVVAACLLLLRVVVGGVIKTDPSHSVSRRCIGQILANHTATTREGILELLYHNTTCNKCTGVTSGVATLEKGESSDDKSLDGSGYYHVTIFFNHPSPALLSLAAALVTQRLNVTILNLQSTLATTDSVTDIGEDIVSSSWIKGQITSRTPCYLEVDELLNVIDIANATIDAPEDRCWGATVAPLDSCTLNSAKHTLGMLNKWFQDIQNLHQNFKDATDDENVPNLIPDVLVMDAAFLGGLLFSEIWKIPTVTVSSHTVLALSVEHDGDWIPHGWSIFYRIYRLIKQRLYSLSLTSPILHLNRIRRDLGLSPIRTPTTYFNSVLAIVVDFARQDIMWHSLVHHYVPATTAWTSSIEATTSSMARQARKAQSLRPVHVVGALLPYCSPCIEDPAFGNNSNAFAVTGSKRREGGAMKAGPSGQTEQELNSTALTLLVSPPPNMTPPLIRDLIRGLALARTSLATYDDCEWDTLSCRNDVIDFSVVWLVPIGDDIVEKQRYYRDRVQKIPQVLPPYITIEASTSLLDSVARHPTTVAVVGHCTDESQIVANIGVSVFCISQSDRLPPLADGNGNHGLTTEESGISVISVPLLNEKDGGISSQEIATQLLGLLRHQHQTSPNNLGGSKNGETEAESHNSAITSTNRFSVDGMRNVVSLIRRVAHANRISEPWSNVVAMQHGLASAAAFEQTAKSKANSSMTADDNDFFIENERNYDDPQQQQRQQPYDSFTVLIAWLIFAISSVFIALKDTTLIRNSIGGGSSTSSSWRFSSRRSYHHSHNQNSKGILTRLHDLDDAWDTLKQWYEEQTSLLPESIVTATTFGTTAATNGTNGASSNNLPGAPNTTITAVSGSHNNNSTTAPRPSGNSQQHQQNQHNQQTAGHHHNNSHVRRRRKR